MTDAAPMSGRDGQARSPFSLILARLCASARGVQGAGIVDEEGETVDIAIVRGGQSGAGGERLDAYAIKLVGACMQIGLRQAKYDNPEVLTRLDVFTNDRSYVVAPLGGGFLGKGYVLVVICAAAGAARVSLRALREAVVGIAIEAVWSVPKPDQPRWRRVRVRTSPNGSPSHIEGRALRGRPQVTAASSDLERSYRVRMAGAPLFGRPPAAASAEAPSEVAARLVREPSGHWYMCLLPSSERTSDVA